MNPIKTARFGRGSLPALAIALAAAACASAPKSAGTPGAESNIQLCIVDTIAPGGMMTIGAIHVHATNDTVILQPEGRVPVAKAVAGPKVLSQATWITAKQPLQLTTARGRIRFVRSGQPKTFAPGKIALLAMMRGVPVFALGREGGAMRPELESLAARSIDLERALQQRVSLRRQMDRVKTLYIPTSLVGCVFQPFTRAAAPRR
ncbi:MAG TPA: hypothetical protein VF021_05955 [Longimicrobiales bacterium]